MRMQRDAQVPACVDSTSKTVEVWGPTRQLLALALYVGQTVRRSRGSAGDWDSDTEMHRVRRVMPMVGYGEGRGDTLYNWCPRRQVPQERRTKESPTGFKMDSHGVHCGPVEEGGTPAHEMGWGGGGGTVERAKKVRTRAILRALESQIGRSAEGEEAEDIKEQIRLALQWVDGCKEGDQPRRIVPPGTEEGARQEALVRASKIVEDARKQGREVEENPERGRQGRWRRPGRERGGQMTFIVGDGVEEEQRDGMEGQAQEEKGREPRPEADAQVGQERGGAGKEWGRGKERRWTRTGGMMQ